MNVEFYQIFESGGIKNISVAIQQQLQWLPFENGQSPFYVVNEVYLTGQKPSLKFCYPHEILTQFVKGLDLLMLKIWGL